MKKAPTRVRLSEQGIGFQVESGVEGISVKGVKKRIHV